MSRLLRWREAKVFGAQRVSCLFEKSKSPSLTGLLIQSDSPHRAAVRRPSRSSHGSVLGWALVDLGLRRPRFAWAPDPRLCCGAPVGGLANRGSTLLHPNRLLLGHESHPSGLHQHPVTRRVSLVLVGLGNLEQFVLGAPLYRSLGREPGFKGCSLTGLTIRR